MYEERTVMRPASERRRSLQHHRVYAFVYYDLRYYEFLFRGDVEAEISFRLCALLERATGYVTNKTLTVALPQPAGIALAVTKGVGGPVIPGTDFQLTANVSGLSNASVRTLTFPSTEFHIRTKPSKTSEMVSASATATGSSEPASTGTSPSSTAFKNARDGSEAAIRCLVVIQYNDHPVQQLIFSIHADSTIKTGFFPPLLLFGI